MDAITRKKKLDAIRTNEEIVTKGVPIKYQGTTEKMDVYKIPLEFLIYNKYNGRISSSVKAHEATHRELNPESPEDINIIERFLWDSKEDRNKRTMKDLVENGQLRYGIVTSDGTIIDGNRRASLLNRAYKMRDEYGFSPTDVEKCQYFYAVILPSSATPRDIQQLETTYQMGEDEKLDYNPIEKYLKCRDLKELGFDEDEIGKMMGGEKKAKIAEWLQVIELMDEYLDSYDRHDMYPLLEHVEDQFLSLNSGLKLLRNHSQSASTDWEYQDEDIDDLKDISFSYIRAKYEGKDFRRICKPNSTTRSLFQKKDIWEAFRDQHYRNIDSYRESPPNFEDSEEEQVDILRRLDEQWKGQLLGSLKNNFKYQTSRLDDYVADNKPKQILERVNDMLNTIDTNKDGFYDDEEVGALVNQISRTIYRFKKLLGQ